MALNYSNPADIFGLQKQNVPIGQKAASPSSNLQPTPNTLGKGFVEPYQPTPSVKSTANGTTGSQYNISTPSGPSYVPPPQTGGSSGAIDYTLHPGESINAYNARIASARGSSSGVSGGSQSQTQQGQGTPPPATNQTGQGGQTAPSPYQVGPGLYGQLITGLANTATQPNAAVAQAQADYQKAVQNLANFRSNLAQQYGGIESQAIPLEFQQGREQVLARQAAGQEAALSQGVTQAQQGIGYGLQQQQLAQSGLGTAAGYAQPQQYGITGVPFNPATGQFGGIAGGGQSGQGLFGVGQTLQAQNLGAEAATLGSVQNQARGIAEQLNTLMQGAGKNINPSGLSFVNGLFQAGAGQLGDPNYQTFSNLLNDLISRYSAILTPAGGNQTDARLQIAQSLINKFAAKESIQQVLADLDQQATGVIQQLNPNAPKPGAPQGSVLGGGGNTFGSFFSK